MSPEQARLEQLYRTRWPQLCASASEVLTSQKYSFPLLMDLDAHAYLNAPVRFLVVGQETFGWVGDGREMSLPGGIERALSAYGEFALGQGYTASPFWVGCRELYRKLNPKGPELGFAWTNLLKIDEAAGRPSIQIVELLFQHFNVLSEEITILKPNVVVFFTGPYYDVHLERTFPGLQYEPIRDRPIRALAQVRHEKLPRHSFRTYHPNFLRRAGKWAILQTIIEEVVSHS